MKKMMKTETKVKTRQRMRTALRNRSTALFAAVLIFFFFAVPGRTAPPQEQTQAQTRAPLKILISNDDGVKAPGIEALFKALLRLGTVTVAAPSQNNSGVGHSLTFSGPIGVEETRKDGMTWFAIDARPATCVRMAVRTLLAVKPDIVASGINRGDNLGFVTFSSGTAACAREAAYYGIPAVAFSLMNGEVMDYDLAAEIAAEIIAAVSALDLKPGVFLNVNIPSLPREQIQGIRITRLCLQPPADIFEPETTREGKKQYRSIYVMPNAGAENTDVWAVEKGYVSITPFTIDQTIEQAVLDLEALRLIRINEIPRPGAGAR